MLITHKRQVQAAQQQRAGDAVIVGLHISLALPGVERLTCVSCANLLFLLPTTAAAELTSSSPIASAAKFEHARAKLQITKGTASLSRCLLPCLLTSMNF